MIEFMDIIKITSISFVTSLLLGPIIIPLLKKLRIGQSIREVGPQSHLKKSGTPTMGGIIILLAILFTVLISGILNKEVFIILLASFGFGMIGFIDDFLIVVRKNNDGLKASQKIIGQVLLALILAGYQAFNSETGNQLIIPFIKNQYLNLGIFYIPIITFIIVGTVNSVNLTDGLDGLASGVTFIVLAFFALIAFKSGKENISMFSIALGGACVGFIFHNAYPAKVFMGDTGSMALGGAVSAIAVLLNLPLLIPIVGGIYFAEALSVIIQVLSFKIRGKRVFLMSPLHHHYEQKGWKETKVVLVFWTITLILCIIGYYSLI